MCAQAAWSSADGNGGYRRQLDQIDCRERSIGCVTHISEKMKAWPEERWPQFQGNFAESEAAEEKQQKNKARIKANFSQRRKYMWRGAKRGQEIASYSVNRAAQDLRNLAHFMDQLIELFGQDGLRTIR